MAAYSLVVLVGGVYKALLSSGATVDYSVVRVGASNIAISEASGDLSVAASVRLTSLKVGASLLEIKETAGHFDFSAKRLTNIATPVAASDAATKGYVDAGNFANKELSNLGVTAVNADINPSADNIRKLGSAALNYSEVNARALKSNAGLALQATSGVIVVSDAGDVFLSAEGAAKEIDLSADSHVSINSATGDIIINAAATRPISNNTKALGTDALEWKEVFTHAIKHSDATNRDLDLTVLGNNGSIVLQPHGTGTVDVGDAKITSVGTPTATTDAATKGYVDAADAAIANDVGNLVTLSGVAVDSVNLGTFTGTTIPDSQTVKQALQALESSVESVSAGSSQVKISSNDTTAGYLEDKIVSANAILSIATLNDGLNEDLQLTVNQGSIDHGSIAGLADDDHTQYHNDARGDARYYQKTEFVTTATAGAPVKLDGAGKIAVAQLPSAVMTYEGVWNASTNSPSLADGVGDAGMVYRVSVAGTQFTPSIAFDVGDYAIYNGTKWEKSDTTDAVASVNGATGIVTVNAINQLTGDVTAGPASGSESKVATIAASAVTTSKIANAAVDETKLAASVAGSGLSGGAGSALAVNVDDSTIEINTDILRVKDGGISSSKIASAAVDETKLSASVAGNGLTGGAGSALAVNVDAATLEISSDVVREKVSKSFLNSYGSAITVRQIVLIDIINPGEVTLVRADVTALNGEPLANQALGMVFDASISSAASGAIRIKVGGIVSGFSGLTPGARYYLDPTTYGAITSTAPSASNKSVYLIGEAMSATELRFNPRHIIDIL